VFEQTNGQGEGWALMEANHKRRILGSLNGVFSVSSTALAPLSGRAKDCLRPGSLLHDVMAVRLAERLGCLDGPESMSAYWSTIRTALLDRTVRQFLTQHPGATIVELGCGLNTRYERLDNGVARWIEVDLPAMVRLRETLVDRSPRREMLACSVLDRVWIKRSRELTQGEAVLVVAEGLLMYLDPSDVRELIGRISGELQASALLFDYADPNIALWQNRAFSSRGLEVRFRWQADRATDLATDHLAHVLLDDSLVRLAKRARLRLTARWRFWSAFAAVFRRRLLHGHRIAYLSR